MTFKTLFQLQESKFRLDGTQLANIAKYPKEKTGLRRAMKPETRDRNTRQ